MSTETTPESCPFCGGADGIERKIYRETTIERLTRERDLAMAALERLDARVKRLANAGDRMDLLLRCEAGIEDTEEWANATREMQLAMIAKARREWLIQREER